MSTSLRPPAVLVVDDEEPIREVLATFITAIWPEAVVRFAECNNSALEVLMTFTPDVITTDINHPGDRGDALLAMLSSNPHAAGVPVVIISGVASLDDTELALYRAGYFAVLTKPVDVEQIARTLGRALRIPANRDYALLRLGHEMRSLDYKQRLDLESKLGRASLAKDVIAMANWGGGTIVVGVAEPEPGRFVLEGLAEDEMQGLEGSLVVSAINPYLDPPVSITARRVEMETKSFVFLEVPATVETLVLAGKQNDEAGLYRGRIYSRTSDVASGEVRASAELRDLLSRLQSRSRRVGGE